MTTYTSVSIAPNLADTTIQVHEPDTNYRGEPRQITCIEFGGGSRLLFDAPAEALAWLVHCSDMLNTEMVRRANANQLTIDAALTGDCEHDYGVPA